LSKSSPQVPTPANPVTVANAQTTSNLGTSAAQQAENNVNQVGPNGSVNYSQTGTYTDPTTGTKVPTYTQTTTLDPLTQSILAGTKTAANTLVPTAQNLATQAGGTATTPLNPNQTANNSIIAGGPQALDPTVANAVTQQQESFLNPQWNQTQQNLTDQLSRAGIPVGSDAYNSAMTNFNNSKTQAYQSAQDAGTTQGATNANNMFGLALQGQNQNLGQQQTLQSNPLSLLSQIYGGQGASA
jgi:hypothetical protein